MRTRQRRQPEASRWGHRQRTPTMTHQKHLVAVVCKVRLEPPTAVHAVEPIAVAVRPVTKHGLVRRQHLALTAKLCGEPHGVTNALPIHQSCTHATSVESHTRRHIPIETQQHLAHNCTCAAAVIHYGSLPAGVCVRRGLRVVRVCVCGRGMFTSVVYKWAQQRMPNT
jgi:hypothetical protein